MRAPITPARVLWLEGRWFGTEAGIRAGWLAATLTAAAQRRVVTGLSLALRCEYVVVGCQAAYLGADILAGPTRIENERLRLALVAPAPASGYAPLAPDT